MVSSDMPWLSPLIIQLNKFVDAERKLNCNIKFNDTVPVDKCFLQVSLVSVDNLHGYQKYSMLHGIR